MQFDDTMINEIKFHLMNGNVIYLKKQCAKEAITHKYYQITNKFGSHIFHVRYSDMEGKLKKGIKDYPTITFVSDDTTECENQYTKIIEKIKEQVNNGYDLTCKRKK